MIIVSDTTVVSNFLIVKRMDLLKFVYQELIIPTAVANELIALKSFNIDTSPIFDSAFIRIQSPENVNRVTEFKKVVDAGEAEAITLALELGANFILIDELKGRKLAESQGLTIIRTLGTLTKARQKNFIPEIKILLDDMIATAGYWITKELYNQVLADAGE